MEKRLNKIKLIVLLIIVFGWATIVFAFSSGPPAARTGAPGEGTCADCHSGGLNNGGGSVTLTGLPANYVLGMRYTLTVTVAKSDRRRWGFEATAIRDDGSAAGTFTVTNSSFTNLTNASVGGRTRSYMRHTRDGTQAGKTGSASFTFDWTAPTTDVGNVTFYVAGNAADGNGSSSNDNTYTINVEVAPPVANIPTIANLNPPSGPADGGTMVTITGTNFSNGISTTFDGIDAPTTFVDNKTIRAVTPPHAAGTVDVIVKNSDGQTARLRSSFTYEASPLPAPVLNTITPIMGPTEGGTDITLIGSNFVSGATVLIGTRQATVMSATATQISARTQPSDPGTFDVIVKNPDGQVSVLTAGFTYIGDAPAPMVKLLTPNGGEILSAGGLAFQINWMQMSGSNATQQLDLSTDGGQTFSSVIANGLPASQTSFSYAVPANIASDRARIRISVTDNGNTISDISDQDVRILAAPTITTIKPTVTSSIKLKITGAGFVSGAVIEVNGTAATTTFKSATSLVGKKISISLVGQPTRIRVRNPNGTISAEMTITP